MSEGEIEVEAVTSFGVLPKEVVAEIGSVKLFSKFNSVMCEQGAAHQQTATRWAVANHSANSRPLELRGC